jgi:hypothetical protein
MRALVAILSIATALAVQESQGTAVLKGRLVDAVTGKPLRGFSIRATYQPRLPYTPGIDPRPPDRSTRTGMDGAFEIAALAAGDYSIGAAGTTAGGGYLEIAYGIRRPGGYRSHLTVPDGASLDITIRAWPAASISGKVIDERGRPIVGVAVRLLAKDNDRYGADDTDDLGVYRIGGLPPGRYATFVAVVGENRTVKANPPARPAGDYSLPWFPYLVDRDLRTVLYNHGVPLPPPTEDGQPNVFVSSYHAGTSAADATYVTLSTGEDRGDVDITLHARRGRRVAGVATVASGSVAGVILTLKPVGVSDLRDYGRLTATAATDGTFVFVAAPEGEYTLTARRRGPPLTEVSLAGGVPAIAQDDVITGDPDGLGAEMPFTVGDTDVDGLAVHLGPGTRVAGRVIFENETFDPRTMTIGTSLSKAGDISFGDSTRWLKVAADGGLSGTVQPGRYVLHVQGAPKGWSFTGATLNGRAIGDGPIGIGGDPIGDLELVFSRAGTMIRGVVTGSDRLSTADTTALAFSSDRDAWPGLSASETLRAKSVTARGGHYDISGLLPGDYFVVAIDERFPATALSLSMLARLAEGAAQVRLQPGQPVTLNLTARSIDP